jgi:predicted ester cyclase
MTPVQYKQVIRDHIAALNLNIQSSVNQYVESPPLKEYISLMEKAFPGFQVYIQDMIAEGDKVAVRFRSTGSHEGNLMGIEPTHLYSENTGMALFQLADEKIVDYWMELDRLNMFQQLGVITGPKARKEQLERPLPFSDWSINSVQESRQNKQTIRDYVAAVNRDKQTAFDRYIDAEYLPRMNRTVQNAFPDYGLEIKDLLAEGDKVFMRYVTWGTHTAPLLGIEPTFRRIQVTGMVIYRLAHGRIVEYWMEMDQLKIMQEIGAVPAILSQEAHHA